VKRCMEQWLLWILVNGISVGMWLKVYLTGGNSIATLLWWLIMLITGVIFYIKWYQDVNKVEHSA
jgi:nicotinamide mononucleotide transporter